LSSAALRCARCDKRLSRKTARVIDGKVLCSTCMFAAPIRWPKELRSLEDIHLPVRFVSREELREEYPHRDSDTRPKAGDAKQGSTRE
jgi:hypothetical protein